MNRQPTRTPKDRNKPRAAVRQTARRPVRDILQIELFSIRSLLGRAAANIRGHYRGWHDTITAAELPAPIGQTITTIVKRTRLWSGEKREVARELVSHAREALDADRTPDDITVTLGDPHLTAKLIRRSMKRKRPLLWHIHIWSMRAAITTAGILLSLAGLIATRYFFAEPTLKRDFIAELNAPRQQYSQDEWAWPLLKDAWLSLDTKLQPICDAAETRRLNAPANERDQWVPSHHTGMRIVPYITASHPDHEQSRLFLSQITSELDRARNAAKLPILGATYASRHSHVNPDGSRTRLPSPITDPEDSHANRTMEQLKLPYIRAVRTLSRWLSFDAIVRAERSDGNGMLASLDACYGLIDQLAHERLLLPYMVATSMEQSCLYSISKSLTSTHHSLPAEILRSLMAATSRPRLDRIPWEGEQMYFDDFLQRNFTDNGHGDGRLTRHAADDLYINLRDSFKWEGAQGAYRDLLTIFATSRRAQHLAAKDVYSLMRQNERIGEELFRSTYNSVAARKSEYDVWTHRPLYVLIPHLDKILKDKLIGQTTVDATLIAIAAELYRRDHNAWPATVQDLVPTYLPTAPEDPFTGRPLLITPGDTTIIVYATGPDLDDDGGTTNNHPHEELEPKLGACYGCPPKDQPQWALNPVDGDWVIFPIANPWEQ